MSLLSDYFRAQAAWRQGKAEDYPDDKRNARSAAALESLAEYIETDTAVPPADRAVLDALTAHVATFEIAPGAGILGGEETQRTVSRYGFDHAVTTRHHRDFLAELLVLCLMDAYEAACASDGDDPTGTLFDFECEAAREGVHLPRSYFESRGRSAESDLRATVNEYAVEHRAEVQAISREIDAILREKALDASSEVQRLADAALEGAEDADRGAAAARGPNERRRFEEGAKELRALAREAAEKAASGEDPVALEAWARSVPAEHQKRVDQRLRDAGLLD